MVCYLDFDRFAAVLVFVGAELSSKSNKKEPKKKILLYKLGT